MATSNPPPTFSSLPQEIRDDIWLQTLTPRFLYIHQHREYSPPLRHTIPKLEREVGDVTITAIRFTHTTSSPPITPGAAFKAYADASARNRASPSAASPHARSDAPPTALLVCRESRNLALKNGYVLAFQDISPRPQNPTGNPSADVTRPACKHIVTNYLGPRSIWINFSRDTVMFDLVNRPGAYPRFSEPEDISPFPLLAQHHASDLAQIRYLALGGSLASIIDTLKAGGGGRTLPPTAWWAKLGMDALSECYADDEFEVEGSEGGRAEYYRWSGDAGMAGVRSYRLSEKGEALRRLVERVEMIGVAGAGPKPRLSIVRGEEWHGLWGEM